MKKNWNAKRNRRKTAKLRAAKMARIKRKKRLSPHGRRI